MSRGKNHTTNGETDEETQHFDLKPLLNFVQREFFLSEYVRNILNSDCEEARFALKSWPREIIIHKEIHQSVCTCYGPELEHNLQIKEIDRTILQKQELKEKLKTNLLKERSRARKPDIREIYMPKSKSSTCLKRSSSTSQTRLGKKQENKCKIVENSQVEILLKRRSFSGNRQTEINSKFSKNENKKLPELSHNQSKVISNTSSQTNFVLSNKLNFTKITQSSDNRNHLPPLMRTETTLSKDFMKKVLIQSTNDVTDEKVQENVKCPLHSSSETTKLIDRNVKFVDAIEGLDRHGVPSYLVKVFKDYHSYLSTKFSHSEMRDKRAQESSNNFLSKFNNMCLERKTETSKFKTLPILVKGFIEILGEFYHKDSNNIQKNELKAKYSTLNLEYKNVFTNKKEKSKVSESCENLLYKKGWMSNGIWNDLCIPHFEGMLKILCIRYSNRAQLTLLFDVIQQLQRANYREVLLQYLLYKVIPCVKNDLEPCSKEFAEAYKMCFTIIQILNPKAPVLVKTDN